MISHLFILLKKIYVFLSTLVLVVCLNALLQSHEASTEIIDQRGVITKLGIQLGLNGGRSTYFEVLILWIIALFSSSLK